MIELLNIDCMEYMATLEDKAFDLAICDPPYGIGNFWEGGDTSAQGKIKRLRQNEVDWNNETPKDNYWDELKRVSINQIVWGWNYYTEFLGNSDSLIYWDKKMGAPNYSQGELAWTSFNHKVRYYLLPLAIDNRNRTHPCQKPVKLYKWLLKNYAKPGDKILDTHGGSMSIAIACHQMGFDLTLCEIDKDYYQAGVKRYNEAIKQQSLFSYDAA